MTNTHTAPLALHPETGILVLATDDEQEDCDYCGLPCTEDYPGEICSGHDGPIHRANQFDETCHYDSGCRRPE